MFMSNIEMLEIRGDEYEDAMHVLEEALDAEYAEWAAELPEMSDADIIAMAKEYGKA